MAPVLIDMEGMTQSDETMDALQRATNLSLDLKSALRGSQEARDRVLDRSEVVLHFPAESEQAAREYAEPFEEDLSTLSV